MKALLIIDAQNEFSPKGQRSVHNFYDAVTSIAYQIDVARRARLPIAWVRHYNKPNESSAFKPGTWGSRYIQGLLPDFQSGLEKEFIKDVFGTFTGTNIQTWLQQKGVSELLLTGFYTHACVSTTAREALMRGYEVLIDPQATATIAMSHGKLGTMSAQDIKTAALLHLEDMGIELQETIVPYEFTWLQFKETLLNEYEVLEYTSLNK